MSKPAPWAWVYRWRWPLFLGVLFGLAYLKNQYLNYRERQQQAERVRQARSFLKASNPVRVRAGLWPITPAYRLWICQEDRDDNDLVVARLFGPGALARYAPRVVLKSVAFDPEEKRLAETEEIRLRRPAPDTEQVARKETYFEHDDRSLLRRYDYREAAAGRNPWKIKLGDSFNFDHPGDRRLTVAQMDSVLAYWRAHGVTDSLADVWARQRHPQAR